MGTPEVVHVDSAQVFSALNYAQAIDVLRSTLAAGFDPEQDAVRTRSELRGGEFLFMPSQVGAYAGVKVLTVTPDNPRRGLPQIQGTCLLLDAQTHQTLAIIDGVALTNLRTPAVSLAGISAHLTQRNPDGVNMVLFGNGVQALPHVKAAQAVVPVNHLTVVVRAPGKGAAVVAGARGITAAEVVAGTPEAHRALRAAGLAITATSSSQPLFDANDVADHACVVAMGSHSGSARELPGALLARSTVVVESMATARAECGDVVLAVDEGHVDWDSVVTMNQVLDAGSVPADKPVVFKTAGMSWEDIAVAAAVYEAAKNR